MCEGTALLHSGHVFSKGALQRFAPRRILLFILDILLFGTAMVLEVVRGVCLLAVLLRGALASR